MSSGSTPPAAADLDARIERHVASRLRLRRALSGMTQADLADRLGITFQQVFKLEHGANRLFAGRLYLLAAILRVPVGSFFEGLDRPSRPDDDGDAHPPAILERRELDLLRAWRHAPELVADAVAGLLSLLAPDAAEGPLSRHDGTSSPSGPLGDHRTSNSSGGAPVTLDLTAPDETTPPIERYLTACEPFDRVEVGGDEIRLGRGSLMVGRIRLPSAMGSTARQAIVSAAHRRVMPVQASIATPRAETVDGGSP